MDSNSIVRVVRILYTDTFGCNKSTIIAFIGRSGQPLSEQYLLNQERVSVLQPSDIRSYKESGQLNKLATTLLDQCTGVDNALRHIEEIVSASWSFRDDPSISA